MTTVLAAAGMPTTNRALLSASALRKILSVIAISHAGLSVAHLRLSVAHLRLSVTHLRLSVTHLGLAVTRRNSLGIFGEGRSGHYEKKSEENRFYVHVALQRGVEL